MSVYSVDRQRLKSLCKLAHEKGIGLATAHNVVRHTLKFFAYKLTAVQQLQSAGNEKRIRQWFKTFIHPKSINILDVMFFFTDETCFYLSGYVSSHNSRLLSPDNPRAVHETPLYDHKVAVYLQYPNETLLVLYYLQRQWIVNTIVQYSTMLLDSLRKKRSITPGSSKMTLLRYGC